MKANELMIGDWCATEFNAIADRRPYSERPRKADLKLINQLADGEQPTCGIVPIPLTEDILKVNGWTAVPEYDIPFEYDGHTPEIIDYHWSPDENIYPICLIQFLPFQGIWKAMEGVTIRYVHQLQHALRLCELTELADNFKVL